LYLQKLQTSGTNLIKTGGALTLSSTNFSAALPSVAVADNGVVGVLFDEYDGTNFHVHLALSYDEGSCIATNQEVYSFATNGMVVGYGIANHNRLLGDFGRMLANGNTLYGAFAARGNVSAGGLTTTNFIVPFFFSADASIAQPAILRIVRISNTNFEIDFAGTPGATYYVQAVTNLTGPVIWQTVSTNVASGSGLWPYTNSTSAFPQRYFRASLLP